jgi:heme exporter protein C
MMNDRASQGNAVLAYQKLAHRAFRAMTRFANLGQILRLSAAVRPWALGLALLALAAGLWLALFDSPPDYQQGEAVRIMYIHVPAAWMATMIYATMAVASAVGLVSKYLVAELYTKAAAPLGAGFTALCLISGSLWGQPMWGTWWVWDARLTSVLILFFIYLGYIVLVTAFDDPQRGLKAAGVLTLVGAVNLPIIKFSVDWWNTLHQPASVMRLGGSTLDPSMLWPLLLMTVAFTALFVWLVLIRTETEIAERRIRVLRLAAAIEARHDKLPGARAADRMTFNG